jgi:aminopeptidase N
MLECYEHYLGPYPFINDGFKLVETPYLGMEHQSAIAYGNDYENNEYDFDYIIIHESAHEYWGNSVSIKDLGELWVHESFTTYMESLFVEYFHGKAQAIEYLEYQKANITNQNPMLGPIDINYDNWMDTDIYYKGAWMLHSIRNTIGNDSLWFKLLKDTYQRFEYHTTTSREIINFMDSNTEYNLSPIFQNYLSNEKIPVLKVKEKRKRGETILTYKWKDVYRDFNMPAVIRYGQKIRRLYPARKKKRTVFDKRNDVEIQYATDMFYYLLKR